MTDDDCLMNDDARTFAANSPNLPADSRRFWNATRLFIYWSQRASRTSFPQQIRSRSQHKQVLLSCFFAIFKWFYLQIQKAIIKITVIILLRWKSYIISVEVYYKSRQLQNPTNHALAKISAIKDVSAPATVPKDV